MRRAHGSAPDFNPNSVDAQFARLIAGLDAQDTKMAELLKAQDKFVEVRHRANARVLDEILIQAKSTNGRVTKLEASETSRAIRWRYTVAIGGALSTIAGAIWAVISAFL